MLERVLVQSPIPWSEPMVVGRVSRIVVALAFVPSVAFAQRVGMPPGGAGRMGRGGSIARESGITIPKLVNGVNLLIENRQALALSDTQFTRIIVIKRTLDSTNAPFMRRLDSLQHLFKGGSLLFGNPSPARRDSLAEAHGVVTETQGVIRDNISVWRDKAFALLSSMQLTKAQELEDKAERAIAEETKGKGKS
jgi:hypothetical protein